ncbi:hypothetical protein F503_04866 [Ophiostoma piceae UAMH 11346]|uniref:Arylsulfotransferase n=1 Tax=Ophiostoma piceae (strain UAMH 11346) TaxID=1262450 RepID=S3CCG6_OPHP1|nr:hypothetical protein F503_04866 [Ophiostoma piceae UAMH 11346]
MRSTSNILLVLLQVLLYTTNTTVAARVALSTASESSALQGDASSVSWYDWGWYGIHPEQHFTSFGASPPRPFILQHDAQCSTTEDENSRYTFVSPRGLAFKAPGPIIYDGQGNLVWMDTQYGEAMDLKVQHYNGQDYITFWHGSDNGTFGEGQYYMINSTYDVAHIVRPAGNFSGDLHEFRITEQGTALMTMYKKMEADLTEGFGIKNGWIVDSMFQEVDLATGRLLFQWHASEHFPVQDTEVPIRKLGRSESTAFDYFHINSVDKTAEGDYVISSRYMCAVACISHVDGKVLWQLGGKQNDFKDLSNGHATDIHWQHHATWHSETSELTVFDNGAYDKFASASNSRGLRIKVDVAAKTATLVQSYVAPQHHLAPSQGSVQILSGESTGAQASAETVLVGWGYIPAYTEFSADGKPLCDVHICPTGYYHLGWCKNYRTFKHHWVGRPTTKPSAAMRPSEDALYVSWNGATEVRSWQLQISKSHGLQAAKGAKSKAGGTDAKDYFTNHGTAVKKTNFESKIRVPSEAVYVRVAALDKDGNVLGYSETVSTVEFTVVALMPAPPLNRTLSGVMTHIVGYIALGVVAALLLVRYRGAIFARVISVVAHAMPARKHEYEALPTAMVQL